MNLLRCCLFLVISTALFASTVYDLKTDWSDTNNPNGPWAFWQGATLLPHQNDSLGVVCCGYAFSGWAPSAQPGDFLPWWNKMPVVVPGAGWLPGDVGVHSVDWFNGNPNLGEASVTWTAPVTGTIDIIGGVWYGQVSSSRSDDFFLLSGTTVLAGGTVSLANGRTRDNPATFNLTGLQVNAGDIVRLRLQRTDQSSPYAAAGSWTGVDLTITETPASGIPEPATCTLILSGLVATAFRARCLWRNPGRNVS